MSPIIRDPIFLEMIKRLKIEKPQNYHYREVDLYNNGQDAVQQEIKTTGNVFQVLSLPIEADVRIQFNETENPTFKLEEGIILFTFYRFFLTYKHTGDHFLLKLLIGKDFIAVNYPADIEKHSVVIVDAEKFIIPVGSGEYLLPCKNAWDTEAHYFTKRKFNHVRGIVQISLGPGERKFYVHDRFSTTLIGIMTEIMIPSGSATSFFIDLVGKRFCFSVDQAVGEYNLTLYAELWDM
ncbi:hypothetical protein ES705_38631 [subsurface metagenome]